MQLEDLVFRVRPRPHWEALDLGTVLARRWYARLLLLWLTIATPVFLLSYLLLSEYSVIAFLLVWWLKPLFERIPLKFLSGAVFGDTPDYRTSLMDGVRALAPGMSLALSIRRLSPMRSFEAPVFVLEGLKGTARAGRLSVLQPKAGASALWLTVLGIHVESFLLLAMLAIAYLFIPTSTEVDWGALLTQVDSQAANWLVNVMSFICMALVAPFYVACGFTLYLNRRVELEAWDIELGFRRLAQRLRTVLVPVVLLVLALPATDGQALEAPPEPDILLPADQGVDLDEDQLSGSRRASREAIERVLAGEDFHQVATAKYPKFLDWFSDDEEPGSMDLGWLGVAMTWIARIVEVLLWAVVIGVLVWLGYRVRLFDRITSRGRARPAPQVIGGLAVTQESLPDDVATQARRLWAANAKRDALGLVYRASLSRLITRFDCPFRESHTEGDCLALTRANAPPPVSAYFDELTHAWIGLAYAHRLPDQQLFFGLVERWDGLLDVADAR